jgi:hypothetical protein
MLLIFLWTTFSDILLACNYPEIINIALLKPPAPQHRRHR